jgi:F-type H+-transporting ATPase subunit epsilon
MSAALHLTITTPAVVLVDSDEVASLRAEDASGSFGILPSHADLLTMLTPSVVRWRTVAGHTGFCAVKGGVLTVSQGHRVAIACREGIVDDSLQTLEERVRVVRAEQVEAGSREGKAETVLKTVVCDLGVRRSLHPSATRGTCTLGRWREAG